MSIAFHQAKSKMKVEAASEGMVIQLPVGKSR